LVPAARRGFVSGRCSREYCRIAFLHAVRAVDIQDGYDAVGVLLDVNALREVIKGDVDAVGWCDAVGVAYIRSCCAG